MAMLGETKQNIVDLLTKLQAYESVLTSLNSVHETYKDKGTELYKSISERKLVLIEEVHRLLS